VRFGVIKRLAGDFAPGVPGQEGPVPHQPAVHAGVRRGVAPAPDPIFPTAVGKLPRGHVCTLLDQVKDPALRDWYADRDARNSWSRPVFEHHVATGLHERIAAVPSNFDHLDLVDADQARESCGTRMSSTSWTSPRDPPNGRWNRP